MCDWILFFSLKGDKLRKLRQRCAIPETVSYTMKRISTHAVNQINRYIKVISHISFETRSLDSRTPSLDNGFTVPHQLAWGHTLCDVIFALGTWYYSVIWWQFTIVIGRWTQGFSELWVFLMCFLSYLDILYIKLTLHISAIDWYKCWYGSDYNMK